MEFLIIGLLCTCVLLHLYVIHLLWHSKPMSFLDFFNYMYDYRLESIKLLEDFIVLLQNENLKNLNEVIDKRIELQELAQRMKHGKK